MEGAHGDVELMARAAKRFHPAVATVMFTAVMRVTDATAVRLKKRKALIFQFGKTVRAFIRSRMEKRFIPASHPTFSLRKLMPGAATRGR